MPHTTISINRMPVLTLWAAVVAERFGFDEDAALTLGRAVAVLNAQSKGRKLGIFSPPDEETKKTREEATKETSRVEVCGRAVPVQETEQGPRAVLGGKMIGPQVVRRSLERSFGEYLGAARSALRKLTASFEPAELKKLAYLLYEQFRPSVPEGMRGWGAKGELDLALIRRLARRKAKGTGVLRRGAPKSRSMTGARPRHT
jgi:hypothetical protein